MAGDDWNLVAVRARQAWALLPERPDGSIDWGDVTLGHLDSGYTEHPYFGDLANGQSWLRPADGLNVLEPGRPPLDPLRDEAARGKAAGHGTRTLGVICADSTVTDDAIGTEIGVAPRLPSIPCRVVNSVVLTPAERRRAVARGIAHCIDKDCRVISISLGVPDLLPSMAAADMGAAVDAAYARGIIVVAAAGQVIDAVTHPGMFHRTICCGALKRWRRVWFDYRHGRERIDIWAPGAGITTLGLGADGPRLVEGDDPGGSSNESIASLDSNKKLGKGTGTSYATTHVAAAAALWLRYRRADIVAAYGAEPSWHRIEAFRTLLRTTSGNITPPAPRGAPGSLNIEALLRAPLPGKSTLKAAPAAVV